MPIVEAGNKFQLPHDSVCSFISGVSHLLRNDAEEKSVLAFTKYDY
jgi:hypothetical protein